MKVPPITAIISLLASLPLAAQNAVPTTPRKFDTTRIGEAVSGGSSVNAAIPRGQTTVKTITHIVLGEPRQWKMADGKVFVGKLIAFEDIVLGGNAGQPAVPKNPTIVRNANARFLVNTKPYEVPLERLGADERKFIEDTLVAVAMKK
jgi:hypothetical protein